MLRDLLSILFSLALIVWLLRSVERDVLFAKLTAANPYYLLAAIGVMFFGYVLRAGRWPFFFRSQPPRWVDSFRCVMIGFFMNNILPARMGEFVRAHLGGRATKQSRAMVLATIAAERLADGMMLSVLFVVLFTWYSPPGQLENGRQLYYVAYFFGGICVLTTVVLLCRRFIFGALERVNYIFPGHLSSYTLLRIRRFIEGLEPILHPGRFLLITLSSFVIWSVELYVYYLVTKAFDHPLNLGGLSLFLAAVNFSSLIPAAPGGIGVIETFATVALEHIGIEREAALAMVLVQHFIQIIVVGIPGGVLFLRLGAKIPPADALADEEEFVETDRGFIDVSRPVQVGDAPPPAGGDVQELVPFDVENLKPEEQIEYSVIIPAFNEEHRLPRTLLSVLEYFESKKCSFEILVVDDGSVDRTAKVIRQFERLSPRVRLLIVPRNRGKGYAVRLGMMNARGNLLLFNDADGATPIEELERLEGAIRAGAQVAIGSRAIMSRDTTVATVWYRKLIGRVFNGIVNFVILPGIADTQCGFKLFARDVGRYIFSQQRADRYSFDVEILFLARKAGYTIAEVPVNWTNVTGSKVNLARDSLHMFVDIMKFKLRDTFGGYDAAPGGKR